MAKKLSLKRKQVEIEVEVADGSTKTFILKELTGSERDQFLNVMASKMRVGTDGKPTGVKDFTGLHANLIGLSLWVDEQRVEPGVIQTWPASTQAELFAMAQELSGLTIKEGEQEKNPDPGLTL